MGKGPPRAAKVQPYVHLELCIVAYSIHDACTWTIPHYSYTLRVLQTGSMGGDFSDDYVAELLKKDAKAKNKEYEFVGLSAFRSSRPASNAPKPNTRFLRNIIRHTYSHNAALKEKEEADAKARLRALRKDGTSPEDRSDRKVKGERKLYEPPSKRRRVTVDSDDDERPARHILGVEKRQVLRDGHRQSDADWTRRTYRDGTSERAAADDRDRSGVGKPRVKGSRHKSDDPVDIGHRCAAEETPKAGRRRRSRSPKVERRRPRERHRPDHKDRRPRRSRSAEEALSDRSSSVGPAQATAPVKRGRGARNGPSAMDARFNERYDPFMDAQPEDVSVKGDWDDAVEAFRDRAKWKALGADRLRSAGFAEAEISKWETSGREKGEEDVVWSKKVEDREWDQGKVIDDAGDTSLKASWAPWIK